MVGTIELIIPQAVVGGVPFDCGIVVSGSSPNTMVTVALHQTHGVLPYYPGGAAQVPVGATGRGAGAISGAMLNGPAPMAVLVATASNPQGDVFSPAAAGVKVV